MSGGRFVLSSIDPVVDVNGDPVVGATLTFYNTGTTTLANIFADAGLSTPIANPQSGVHGSNANGRFYSQTTTFWADVTQAYDVVLTYPSGQGPYTYSSVYVIGAAPSIVGYAPINSPVFTGTPQAPTPASNDSSAKIATTAFSQAAISAAIALISQLPSQSGHPGTILYSNGSAASWVTLLSLFGGQSVGSNGYITFPGSSGNSLVIQWGVSTSISSNSQAAVNLTSPNIAFPNNIFGVVAFP